MLNFAFYSKFEAIDEVVGHLTYTRKCYNPGEAPEGLDGVDACERECHGMLHSLPVHLVDSFVHLPSSFAPSPRGSCLLKPTFIPCNSLLNVAAQCETRGVYRLVIAVRWFLKGRPREHTVKSPLGTSFPMLSIFWLVRQERSKQTKVKELFFFLLRNTYATSFAILFNN